VQKSELVTAGKWHPHYFCCDLKKENYIAVCKGILGLLVFIISYHILIAFRNKLKTYLFDIT